MTNIILPKISLKVSLYIRQRNNLFFWQENQIVSEIFGSAEGGYMAGAACQDSSTISTLILSGFIFASFSFLKLQLEYTARLDFLWRVQAKEEINEMKELREHNENMLRNILPSHVARHFLEKDRDNEVRASFLIFLSH